VTVPAVSNRAAVKQAVVDALTAHANLIDVPVSLGWPGKHIERRHVWIARTTGEVTYPHVMAGRKTRQDDYTITVLFYAAVPGDNIKEAEDRVELMFQAFDDLAADGQALSDSDSDTLGLIWSLAAGTREGPNSELDDEKAIAVMTGDISVQARYV
jgi:rRNA maturation endonuclease Nob1